MTEADWIRFIVENGHILMMWTKKEAIEDALLEIASSSKLAKQISNFYNMDIMNLYWEYNLLSKDSETRQMIDYGTKAKYSYVKYCEATIKIDKK